MKQLEKVVSCQWVLTGMIWTAFFGYEALGYSKDPDNCYASDFSDKRVTDLHDTRTDDFVDVGERFRVVFSICYYSSLIMLFAGVLHCVSVRAL